MKYSVTKDLRCGHLFDAGKYSLICCYMKGIRNLVPSQI